MIRYVCQEKKNKPVLIRYHNKHIIPQSWLSSLQFINGDEKSYMNFFTVMGRIKGNYMHYLQQQRYGNNLCPLMDEWIKKLWYLHTLEHFSVIKKKETLSFATTQMDLKGIVLSEIRERWVPYDFFFMWNLKQTKTNQTHGYKEEIGGCQSRGAGGGRNR